MVTDSGRIDAAALAGYSARGMMQVHRYEWRERQVGANGSAAGVGASVVGRRVEMNRTYVGTWYLAPDDPWGGLAGLNMLMYGYSAANWMLLGPIARTAVANTSEPLVLVASFAPKGDGNGGDMYHVLVLTLRAGARRWQDLVISEDGYIFTASKVTGMVLHAWAANSVTTKSSMLAQRGAAGGSVVQEWRWCMLRMHATRGQLW